MFVGILFRYVFREIFVSTVIGAVLFTFVLFLRAIGPVMELLIGPHVSIQQVAYLFVLKIPATLKFTIPIGILVGVLVGLGRLSSDGELTAMRAAGIPGRRLIAPISLWALLGAVVCAFVTLHLNPLAQREFRRVSESLKISQATAQIQPRVFIEDFPNFVLYVRDIIPGPVVRWKGVFLADMRAPEVRGSFSGLNATAKGPAITLAKEAIAVPRPAQDRVQLSLPFASRYEQSHDPTQYHQSEYGHIDQVLEIARGGPASSSRSLEHMTNEELIAEARTGEKAMAAEIEWQQRFAFPVACLVFPLVGIPLAVSSQRSGRSSGVIFGILLVFVYYMVWLGGVALANAAILPVGLAVWSANLVFGAAGLVMLLRLDSPNRGDFLASFHRVCERLKRLLSGKFRTGRREVAGQQRGEPSAGNGPGNGARNGARNGAANGTGGEMAPMFPIVDRYIIGRFLFHFVVLLIAFVTIWWVFSFFELLGDMLEHGKLGQFIPYIYYLTPFLIYETAPLGILVATLICFFILARNHELTAFKACGVSLFRLAAPVLVVSLLVSLGLFALDHRYLPEMNRRQDAIRNEIKNRPVQTYLRPDRQWTFGLRDRIFFHSFFDSETNVLGGVNVYDLDPESFQLRRHVAAHRATWDRNEQVWVFEDGWVREFDGARPTLFEQFERRAFPSIEEGPDHFFKEAKQYRQMNWEELRAYIAELTRAGFDTVKFQVQWHKKFAFPLFAFVMAILAVPFAMLAGHRGAFTGVVLSITLAVAYYSLSAFFESLGGHGQLSPAIAAWSPGMIFALSGAYLFTRVRT